MEPERVTTGHDGTVRIAMRLGRINQLFNSLDPSPFHEKDLDADAEEFIVASAREQPGHRPIVIVIHLPPEEAAGADAGQVRASIRNYFRYREDVSWRQLRYVLRLGRVRLLIALGLLFACVVLRELLGQANSNPFTRVLSEGLLIGGWVAMWQPAQTFLYDWWPLRESCKVLRRLGQAGVEIRAEP